MVASFFTPQCTHPEVSGSISWLSYIWTYFQFLLFGTCPQRLLISSIHLIFFVAFAILSASRFVKLGRVKHSAVNGSRSNAGEGKKVRANALFTVTRVVITLLAVVYCGIAVWRIGYGLWFGWHQLPAQELLYSLSQALAWLVFLIIVGHEKRLQAIKHVLTLRLWWGFTFLLSSLTLLSAVSRFVNGNSRTLHLWVDDIVTLASFPVVVFLLVLAVVGSTGISVEESDLVQSLLGGSVTEELPADAEVTGFYNAGLFSKLTWMWLNPLLSKGKSKTLEAHDVPLLSPDDRAEAVYSKFMANFMSQAEPRSARMAILLTFWPELSITALLALIKISVMYVGPLLISPLVEYVGGKQHFPYEGLVLVLLLFTAKTSEVLSSHHYNFFSNKLGMVIRSCLITAVYRKGLKLSSHARQTHGAGQIVNYMSVDVQQISDCLVQLHNMWILPIQITLALLILFRVVGISCFGGIATMLLVLGFTFNNTRYQRIFQGRIMRAKDERMAAMTEVLNSIRVIKFQAWEDHFRAKIERIRGTERNALVRFQYVLAGNIFFLWQSPVLVAVATFALCVWLHEELTPIRVFTAISTFRIMQDPLRLFPQSLMNISQALNSFERLDKYFWSEELDPRGVEKLERTESEYAVEVESGVFRWSQEENRPTLAEIDLKIRPGSLVAVVGMVGSGKSSLLSAILGEVPLQSGKVKVAGSCAYVAQSSWIQNATIKENILFGKPLDLAKYQETLRVCSLQEDLSQMSFGDRTEIGERGINLSGGQKQRIQLARAVYHDADLYLLDDVFSAVDAHTGSELFNNCIKKALSSKTVILVTHQVEFLGGADVILVMRDGKIVQSGKFDELLEAGTDFSALVAAHNEAMDSVEMVEEEEDQTGLAEKVLSPVPLGKSPSVSKSDSRILEKSISSRRNLLKSGSKASSRKSNANLIEEEKREVGHVGWKVYWLYGTKFGFGSWILLLFVFQTCWQGLQIAGDFYLADATAVSNAGKFKPVRFITTYAEFAFGSGLFVLLRSLLLAYSGLKTSQSFFISLLSSIIRGTMSFFDTTPSGRILTRFANDQSNVDFLIPILLGTVLGQGFQALGIIFVICGVTRQLLIVVFPLAYIFVSYQKYFIATSRELTRIDSVTKAPIIHHFSESIAGFITIRAFGDGERFKSENVARVNANLRMDFHNNAANEWLGFRLEMIGTVVLSSSALLMVLGRSIVNDDFVGLSLSYGLALNGCLYGVIFLACQLENRMVSVERINQYFDIPCEAPAIIADHRPSPTWPNKGNIHFQNLQLRYRKDTPLVLKGINLNILGGEKVGVVGRTGSGKSTLIQALFRLVEPAGGRMIVDGLDITTIGLKDLRTRFAIIPQDPTLFEGTVRTNLDPLGEHSDAEIWEGLEKCQLIDMIKAKEDKLDSAVLENGENWSVGQRQLFCLGRALLKHSQILVLDEATASVDAQTDVVLQKIIREEFKSCTVISIAHRIPTVMDSDKVLVLDQGHIKEFDSPSKLLDQQSSLFAALVREYATRSDTVDD